MTVATPTAGRKDPLTVFCFALEIDAVGITTALAFFKNVSGLTSESEVVDYKEGGHNTGVRRLVGPAKWPNLVLKQGFTGPPFKLLEWRMKFLNDSASGTAPPRTDGKVIQLGSDMQPICSWKFKNGWPVKWIGPEYDASKSELAIETIEIAHEGLEYA